MVTRRKILTGLGGLAGLAVLPPIARAGSGDLIRISGTAFGAAWQVSLPRDVDAHAIGTDLRHILKGIDRSMSPFRADSELSRFNHYQDTIAFPISQDLYTVAAKALEIAQLTNGAFDPGVGPAVHRYGFGPIAAGRPGLYTAYSANDAGLSKADPILSLDLCGIAKGHAVDRLAGYLSERAVPCFLIEVGGEVRACGKRPGGAPWRIGIADPLSSGIHFVLPLTDMAMATSGDAINAYQIAGRRYSHTIDPATGQPVYNSVASVSVLASTAIEADGFATALMVMGPERGLAYASANGLAALYLTREADGLRAEANALFTEQA